MTVYVDAPRAYPYANLPYIWFSHMWSSVFSPEGIAELHALARAIGLRTPARCTRCPLVDGVRECCNVEGERTSPDCWFQNHRRLPHYDVTPSKRRQALAFGAQARELIDYYRERGIVPEAPEVPESNDGA